MSTIRNKVREVGRQMFIDENTKSQLARTEPTNREQEYRNNIRLWGNLYRGKDKSIHFTNLNTTRNKGRWIKTLNAPKFICEELASLICNDRIKIETGSDIINEILEDGQFIPNLQHNLEVGFALGGLVAEPWYDAVNKEININFIKAHAFKPLDWKASGIITAGEVTAETIKKGNTTYKLVRIHEHVEGYATITTELREFTDHGNGYKVVPLSTIAEYKDIEPIIQIPSNKPLISYFKPNLSNNLDYDTPLGISIYANSIDTIKAIDTAYDAMDREVQIGKMRAIVPSTWLRSDSIHPAYFDMETEFYEGMNGINGDDFKMQFINPTLRIDEYVKAINTNLDILATQIGFSAGSFTFQDGGIKTATEVISQNSKTFKTKKSHEQLVYQFLKTTVENLFTLTAHFLNGGVTFDPSKFSIAFDDSIIEDSSTTIKQQILLVQSGLQTKTKAIMAIHNVSEDEAEKMLDEINNEADINNDGASALTLGTSFSRYAQD